MGHGQSFPKGPLAVRQLHVGYEKIIFWRGPNYIPLDTADIWVQVHQLPFGFMNEQIGLSIDSHIGGSVKYDDINNFSPWRKYMRLRVAINTQEPLKK
ncbi:histone-lysine N-methyltransferase ATXR2 [Trifolium medium]|uniref:Histone-lysine N-methyltransferase ATXR2 n=1 Tax=Trifolium medium TaxID=97028 RepID=A0A392NS77_9FABA|nr:histone-lysine N-methyltransferase ATXR2 [Trifolium medium]